MKYKIIAPIILITTIAFSAKAQQWSEPITIYEGSLNQDADFVIDNNHNLHVVWAHKISENFWKIYYSKSTDQGQTWSAPYDIVQNSSLWMSSPKIAVGPDNNLYVTYDYNTSFAGTSMVHMQIFNGDTWSDPIVVSESMSGSYYSRLAMDNNGILHIFWYYFSAGRFQYRTFQNGAFSNITHPFNATGSFFFSHVTVDSNNMIHCIASRTLENSNQAYSIYFTLYNGIWSSFDSICKPYWASKAMTVNSQNLPRMVWVSRASTQDTTRYTVLENNQWQTIILVPKLSSEHSIIVEQNGIEHIVQSERLEAGYNQVHYKLENDIWTPHIIGFGERGFYQHKLIAKDTSLYLLFLYFPLSASNGCLSMKRLTIENQSSIDQFIESNNFYLRVFPNPSQNQQGIKIETKSTSIVQVEIYDTKGILVFKTTIPPSQNSIAWNLETSTYKKIPPGLFFVKARTDKRMKTQTLIITK